MRVPRSALDETHFRLAKHRIRMTRKLSETPMIVMLGPSTEGQGGMASVIAAYRDAGLIDGSHVEFIPTHRPGSKVRKVRTAASALQSLIVRRLSRKLACVHIHVAERISFLRKLIFVAASALTRTPYILHLHGCEFQGYYVDECGPLLRFIFRLVLRASFRVIVLSETWKHWVASIEPAARVEVVHNPVSLPEWRPRAAHTAGNLVILFLGQLGPRKGIYDLLLAVKRLEIQGIHIFLQCGGDGELERVRAQASQYGIDQSVRLLGWVTGSAKEELFRQADVYVLPSYNEGLPMGILEAMAHGLPIVSTNVGGIPDVVQSDVHGYLVTPGDVDGLTEVLARIAGDSMLIARLGNAARDQAQNLFDVRKIMQQLERIYARLPSVQET